MICLQGVTSLVRRLGLLALLGLAVIFLSGPVLALVGFLVALTLTLFGLLIPWVLLGLLVWVPFRAFYRGSRVAWQDMRTTSRGLCRSAVAVPLRTGVQVCARAAQVGRHTRDRLRGTARFVGGILFEALGGAVVGALFGAIAGMDVRPHETPIALGALAGGFLGVVVGASRRQWTEESLSGQAPEQLG